MKNGAFETKLETPYPHGLAQLFGVAFVTAEADAFAQVEKAFPPDTGELGTAGPERWLVAASRLEVDRELAWRAAVAKAAADSSPITSTSTARRSRCWLCWKGRIG